MLKAWPETSPAREVLAMQHPLADTLALLHGKLPPAPPLLRELGSGVGGGALSILGRGLKPRSVVVDEYGRRHTVLGVEAARIGLFVKDDGQQGVELEIWVDGKRQHFEVPTLETAVWAIRQVEEWQGERDGAFWWALEEGMEHFAGNLLGIRFTLEDGEWLNERDDGSYVTLRAPRVVWYSTYRARGELCGGVGLHPDVARRYADALRALVPTLPIVDETGLLLAR